MIEQLRNLPAVDLVLQDPSLAALRNRHGSPLVANWVRSAIDDCRRRMLGGEAIDSPSVKKMIVEQVHKLADQSGGQSIRPVINATGIILHTNLGRSPLAESAIARVQQATGYTNVELNLDNGRRNRRGARVGELIALLVGADDAVVVNNCAAATMLVLQTLAAGREAIVSRGQLVEIGGGFRLPDVFQAAGAILREVGTTNRTYLRDYDAAIGEQTAVIIRVHRSNFYQTGFVTEPSIDELVSIPRPNDVPIVDDLGSGLIDSLASSGMCEPTVKASVASGADLTLFSGDKLFGGPQAGIIVGRRHWIDRLRKSPMMRAMRLDKLALAALEATAEIHLGGTASNDIPVLAMITLPADQVRQRCIEAQSAIADDPRVQIINTVSQIGGGSAPDSNIPSFGLQVSVPHADMLARRLRSESPAIQGRILDDSLLLDFRTIATSEVRVVGDRLAAALRWLDSHA